MEAGCRQSQVNDMSRRDSTAWYDDQVKERKG